MYALVVAGHRAALCARAHGWQQRGCVRDRQVAAGGVLTFAERKDAMGMSPQKRHLPPGSDAPA